MHTEQKISECELPPPPTFSAPAAQGGKLKTCNDTQEPRKPVSCSPQPVCWEVRSEEEEEEEETWLWEELLGKRVKLLEHHTEP